MSSQEIHIVGGGVAGLVASITAAEAGAPVVLHEASSRLGGRALGAGSRPRINLGPHVAFTDGALLRWLRQRGIAVPLRGPSVRGIRILSDAGLRFPFAEAVRLAATIPPRQAPVDAPFNEWAATTLGDDRATLMARLAGLITFHYEPGELSARFVWERWRRTFLTPARVRWIAGGWSTLIDALAARAEMVGVTISLGDRVTASDLPSSPTVIATQLAVAARLLNRPLEWPGTRTTLLDLAVTRGAQWPSVIADVRSDLTTCCMVERETAFDRDLLGDGTLDLFQAQLGISPDAGTSIAIQRIESTLDSAVEGWRNRIEWRDTRTVVNFTGAVDPPGFTWRDRPSISQGDDVYLAGDAVAAPGTLSEVSVNSAVQAARLALDARRHRTFAAGWPSVELNAERRLTILAAAVPGARQQTVTVSDLKRVRHPEPVEETGPGYRLSRRLGFFVGSGTASNGTTRLTTLVSPPAWLPLKGLLSGLLSSAMAGLAHAGRWRSRQNRSTSR